MPTLTIGRMAKLYGLHRSTLHEAVAKGRVTAGLDGKGQRVIDLAEMIRVYGEPTGSPTPAPDTLQASPDTHPTPPADLAELIAQAVAKAVAEAVEPLRLEIERLRLEPARLEHKPAQDSPPPPQAAPRSFADLLANLEQPPCDR